MALQVSDSFWNTDDECVLQNKVAEAVDASNLMQFSKQEVIEKWKKERENTYLLCKD